MFVTRNFPGKEFIVLAELYDRVEETKENNVTLCGWTEVSNINKKYPFITEVTI